MNTQREQADKLKRYFINADPFMWGILEAKNKRGRIKELQQLGLLQDYSKGSNPTYIKINKDLLVELGIEGILERIVVPRIVGGFSPDVLRHFRDCWEQGQIPELKYLRKHGLYRSHPFTSEKVYDGILGNQAVVGYKDPAFVFLQIDAQHSFVERWTVFAGLWFEEIEPLLGSI